MDRNYIDRYLVVDRYLAGDLSDSELAEFEERLVWDQELVDEVDLSETLREGLRASATDESPERPAAHRPVFRMPLAAAASFALGVLASSVFFSQPQIAMDGGPPPTTVVALDVLRSGAEQEVVIVPNSTVVLLVAVDGSHDSYRVAVRRSDDGAVVWRQDDLSRGYAQSLAIGIHASALPAGSYVLDAYGAADGSYELVTEIPFRAVDPD